MFEWYDFYLYGSLAAIIAKQFFTALNPTSGFIFALLAFAAGFAVRPFGALLFGRLGDMIGRKYTFLVTIVIMGLSTFLVGVLPSYATIGVAAPIILITLRLLQGLALGGEYGGAATYVAEHAPHGKRGLYTSFIQTTATLGLFLSLLVILGCRYYFGKDAFEAWGWRIPFLLSFVLLMVSVWIRLQLAESPLFQQMKDEGKTSKAPLTESFMTKNSRIVILALLGATAGQAVVWYAGQFYALFFLTQTLKIEATSANLMIAGALRSARRSSSSSVAVRQDRTQADHHGRLPARRIDLLPDLQGADPLRQSGDRSCRAVESGRRRRGSRRLQLPVQSGRHEQVHDLLRHRQERPGPKRRAVRERSRARRYGRLRQGRPHHGQLVRGFRPRGRRGQGRGRTLQQPK